jgi:hypothetical protein
MNTMPFYHEIAGGFGSLTSLLFSVVFETAMQYFIAVSQTSLCTKGATLACNSKVTLSSSEEV